MILLAAPLRAPLTEWALSAYPREAVGILLGHPLPTQASVTELVPVSNLATEPNRAFVLDPLGWFKADTLAQASGSAIVGIVHTHPDCPAVPSEHDARNASDVGRSLFWLIVQVGSEGLVDVRGWHWDGSEFIEDDVVWN